MRRRVEAKPAVPAPVHAPAPAPEKENRVVLPHDAANEATLVASTFLFDDVRRFLLPRLTPDHFQQREHRDLWQLFQAADHRNLSLDLALVEAMGGGPLARYLGELSELRPDRPQNLAYHVQCILWDYARASAAKGPVPAFIEALRDPRSDPDRVRGLARAIGQSFDGHDDRKYLLDGANLVRDQMREVEARVDGIACFSYGLPGLDFADFARERRRMIPGSAPSQITVVTGISGSGKTTMTANMVLGIAFPGWASGDYESPGRTVLYGAWEMRGGVTLELLACISLGWSRSDLMQGRGIVATPEGRQLLLERMTVLASRIRFLANPFRRRAGEKRSNERNLDLVQGYIADAGCEVFVGDLWKRCLVRTEPEEEEEALLRQQAMVEELGVHAILLQQQRLKDIEMRPDKRPTREGIKGSAAWIEVADTIIGIHRPFLFKNVDDSILEIFVLKQRYGKWPMGVEFDWNSDAGSIRGGKHLDYNRPGETNEIDRAAGLADRMRGRS